MFLNKLEKILVIVCKGDFQIIGHWKNVIHQYSVTDIYKFPRQSGSITEFEKFVSYATKKKKSDVVKRR